MAAKLTPPAASSDALPMPRLDSVFERAADRPITFFVAGAGFGKTTNINAFLRSHQTRSVWLTLDPLDQDEGRVVDYLTAAFGRITGVENWESAGRGGEVSPEALADLFLADLQERLFGRTILVIDEFHQLGGSDSHSVRFFSRLLTYLPENLRTWILSRREPPVLTQKMRSAGIVATIDEEILRWSPSDVAALAEKVGARIGLEEASLLAEITGGRAATVRTILENLSSSGLDTGRIAELAKNPGVEIRRYIEEEVIGALSPAARDALIHVAIPEEIDVPLIVEATRNDDFELDIDELQRTSNLLRATANPNVFRLDPVVRGVVLRIARTSFGPRRVAEIQSALADLHLRRGELPKAILACVESGAHSRAAELLQESVNRLIREGRSGAIRELAEHLPRVEIEKRPQLQHGLARSLLAEGRLAEAQELYRAILEKGKPDASLRAWAHQGLTEAAHRSHRLEEAAKHHEEARRLENGAEPYCRAKIFNDAGILALRRGEYDLARSEWERALALSFDPSVPTDFQKSILHNLGLPTAATGQANTARSYFERLLEGDPDSIRSQKAVALLNLARIALMQGDLPLAEQRLETALPLSEKLNLQKLKAEALELFGHLFRRRGDFERALLALDHAALIYSQIGVDASLEEIVDEQANLELARGNLIHAESLISSLLQRRRESANELAVVTPLLTLGKILAAAGRKRDAEEALEEAIVHARRWNMRYQLAESLLIYSRVASDRTVAARMAAESQTLSNAEGYAFDDSRGKPLTAVTEERADLTAKLFGAPNIEGDLGEAAWPLRKALAIFCYLATSPGHSASKDQLVDLFWGEEDLDVIERNFHPTISFLRRSLRGVTSAGKNFIQFSGGRYRLDPRFRYSIDIDQFQAALGRSQTELRNGNVTDALDALDRALELQSAPFMDGFYDSWVLGKRTQMAEELRRIGTAVATRLLDQKDVTGMLFLTSKLREVDPFDEKIVQLEMKAHATGRDLDGVRTAFARLEVRLRDELQESPSAATRKLLAELTSAAPQTSTSRR